ncbi:MAG: alpha/beta hydrolase [Desulfobacterales bacterium]|nr:alpha/beta hydrolase [Desulfobacterales bacterium]
MKDISNWKDNVIQKSLISKDGLKISYELIDYGAERTVVLANGLGGRLYVWEPLIEKLLPDFKIICWDYRGLFESKAHFKIKRLAIREHAEDLKAILEDENISKASVTGWSMGVQVALEFASLYPENTDKLVLLNGTYGHALSTGFQPLMRMPSLSRIFHEVIDFVKNRQSLIEIISKLMVFKPFIYPLGSLYGVIRGNPKIGDAIYQYVQDVFGSDFSNYLRLFQELDAHSTYHHLREIYNPTLIVWGNLDYLTPAYQSKEMLRKLPNAEKVSFLFGTHFVLLEYPEKVPRKILEFLNK